MNHEEVNRLLEKRGERYGDFSTLAELSQRLKTTVRISSTKNMDWAQMEAIDMILHKIARIVNGDSTYRDSWMDIAGYAKLVADTCEEDA